MRLPRPRRARRAAAAIVALALVGACEDEGPRPVLPRRTPLASAVGDAAVIGLVGTMTGEDSWRGEDAFEGADVAVQLLNRSGRGPREGFQLVTLDDGGAPERAKELIEQLAASPQTVGIVYAGPPQTLHLMEPVLADAGIPAVACFGDLYGARLLAPHVFQASPSLVWEARRLARYAVIDRRYERVGLLYSLTLDGRTAVAALTDAVVERAARPPTVAAYRAGLRPRALQRLLRGFRKRRVEALVVEGAPEFFPKVLAALDDLGARYLGTRRARTVSARPERGRDGWHPQVLGFDLALAPAAAAETWPAGTVASDTYARGAHYLPVPSFERFREAFLDWWGSPPLGWQRRGFEAAGMVGWAAARASPGDDLARTLEQMRGVRLGGVDITLGPDDHTSVDQTSVGLWVIPRPGAPVRERGLLPESFPWVPLSRGFSIDGERTTIASEDWRYLFRDPPPRRAPPPKIHRALFGVATRRSDPVH